MAYIYTNDDKGKNINFIYYRLDSIRKGETEVIISDEVNMLESDCFSCCDWIEKIKISDSVKYISNRAFKGCTGLKTITIPDSVTCFGVQVFQNCINLKEIIMSSNIKELGYNFFENCIMLKKIILPSVIMLSGPTVFSGCTSLQSVVAPKIDFKTVLACYKPLLASGFIESPEFFSEEQKILYTKYILSQKSRLLPLWYKNDYIQGVRFLADNGGITSKNFDSHYFLPAYNADAKQCVSYLLDWKNKNISFDDELENFSKELKRKPSELSEFKKSWKYDTFSDNTIALTCYLGGEVNVVIPEKIGKYTVWRLNNSLFSNFGYEEIENVFIPKSVTEIRRLVFENMPHVTIHAPAGSYAEQYAKENKIPFVAEDK